MCLCEFICILSFISFHHISIKTGSLKAFPKYLRLDFALSKGKISVNILFWVMRATAVNLVLWQLVNFSEETQD